MRRLVGCPAVVSTDFPYNFSLSRAVACAVGSWLTTISMSGRGARATAARVRTARREPWSAGFSRPRGGAAAHQAGKAVHAEAPEFSDAGSLLRFNGAGASFIAGS
jgi:hypothetical protein